MPRLPSTGVSGCSSSADGTVQWISFNCTGDMFTAIVNDYLYIFNSVPLKTLYSLAPTELCKFLPEKKPVPLFRADVLDRTNLLAIIPASISANPRSADNQILFWDAKEGELVGECIANGPILMVKLRRRLCAFATEQEIRFIHVPSLEMMGSVLTKNPLGILAVSPSTSGSRQLAAFPFVDNTQGGVHVVRLSLSPPQVGHGRAFKAHNNAISCIAFNPDATLLATASTQGTLINLFRVDSMQRLCRFRRGMDPAIIYCLSFNKTSNVLAAISDNGTVHAFSIPPQDQTTKQQSTSLGELVTSPTSGLRASSKFDISCRSFSQCAFVDNSVIVVTVDCDYHRLIFSADSSICKRIVYDKFADPYDDTGL